MKERLFDGFAIGGPCAPPMAERVGFEPTMRFRIDAFEAPGINRSPTVNAYIVGHSAAYKPTQPRGAPRRDLMRLWRKGHL